MPTALEQIIDGASDPSVSTANLLRRMFAAARRLDAGPVVDWVEQELSGFRGAEDEVLPVYRRNQPTMVETVWRGPYAADTSHPFSVVDAPPDGDIRTWFFVSFRQSIAELETLAGSEGELHHPLPAQLVGRWNELVDARKAISFEDMSIFTAHAIVQKPLIRGVIDAIRTEVQKLALDLEAAAPKAGQTDGPTIEEPAVAQVVNNFVTQVYGGTATIAQGTSVAQTVTVIAGDVNSLTHAAQELGLEDDDLAEYVDAVVAAKDDPEKTRLQAFLGKVRSGAIALSGGVATNIAADQLLGWATMFLS